MARGRAVPERPELGSGFKGIPHAASEQRNEGKEALQAPRCASADQLPEQQAQVEGTGVDEHSFPDVVMATQVRASHSAGVVEVRERALDALPSLAQQLAA